MKQQHALVASEAKTALIGTSVVRAQLGYRILSSCWMSSVPVAPYDQRTFA